MLMWLWISTRPLPVDNKDYNHSTRPYQWIIRPLPVDNKGYNHSTRPYQWIITTRPLPVDNKGYNHSTLVEDLFSSFEKSKVPEGDV